MNINNTEKLFFLLIISLFEIVQSIITPVDRFAQSSVLIDKKIYFFGGESDRSLKKSSTLDQIIYLDVSKSFSIANPPFEEVPSVIPFGSSFATTLFDSQKNTVYLFGGIMNDVNTDLDNFISVLHSYNLQTNQWSIPKTNGMMAPARRREMNGVIDKNGKIYIFGGSTDEVTGSQTYIVFNDMNIFDTVTLTWTKGSAIEAPLPREDYTATLLSNGNIVFIGGREVIPPTSLHRDVDMRQLQIYDTKADRWSSMTAQGEIVENRNSHSAILTPDEKIIVFGGEKLNGEGAVKTPIAVLDTNKIPYEWSIPQFTVTTLPPALTLHSATLVGNYMIVNFGNNSYPILNSDVDKPFLYILDIRNFTWVTQFDPDSTPSPKSPDKPKSSDNNSNNSTKITTSDDEGKKIGIIVGAIGFTAGTGAIAGFLGYKYYKKRKYYNRAIPTPGEN